MISEDRSTREMWNVTAEAERQLLTYRFTSAPEREGRNRALASRR